MKWHVFLVCLLAAVLFVFGCGQDDGAQPTAISENDNIVADGANGGGNLPPGGYYTFFWSDEYFAYSEFSLIDTRTGLATYLWSLDVDPYPGQDPESWGPMTFGLTYDVDGTMYCTMNLIGFNPELAQSQLARIDMQTGDVTFIGDPVPFNTAGSEIDACGNMYVCGFQVDALGYIFGNSSLWRINKKTGEFIEIGDTGHTNWMDLAFDADGTLWGTFDNQLYTIDTETGASTLITEIHDVPDAGPPNYMEVMSIAFDKHNVLYGSCLTVYWIHPDGSPVMQIDPYTGETVLLGYSHTVDYNHGGDTMPTKVTVCHLMENGAYKPISISLRALPAHQAHGDILPVDCECPAPDMRQE